MTQDQLIVRTRQKDMIEQELLKGRKRKEIIALFALPDDIFEELEASDSDAKDVFKRAEMLAFLTDLDFYRDNLANEDFSAQAAQTYFANRHGWSIKPSRVNRKITKQDDIISYLMSGEIDADLAVNVLKAISLNQDIKIKEEDRERLGPMVQQLAKYIKDNNL